MHGTALANNRDTITGVSKSYSLTRINQAFESTFQRDYGAIMTTVRTSSALQPPPAKVLPKYSCYDTPNESTARETYKGKEHNLIRGNDNNSCFNTHFKLDTDSSFEKGQSTQRDSYRVIPGDRSNLKADFQPKSHLMLTTSDTGNLLGTAKGSSLQSEYVKTYHPISPIKCSNSNSIARGNTTARNTITGICTYVCTCMQIHITPFKCTLY